MKVKFLKSIYDFKDYKGFNLPEFAFAGRSNVGKSSLINTLVNTKIAHTSKTPGKTRAINFFLIEDKYVLADLPGYGYAKITKEAQLSWKELIENYITSSKNLKILFILADISRGLEDEELTLIDWLKYIKRPYKIIFTKTDKLSRNELRTKINTYKDLSPLYFSSVNNEGKRELIKFIEEAL
ncbi:MAG: ribosome biogenesis GTP-binding protein YihA/YsxC [Proteobacteria bacterium]|nr:ribosome biogenesis GTP-binding protein YihA/YsxC [Pseudomonadota bacterium]